MEIELNEQNRYWLWLNSINGIGPKTFYDLIAKFQDAKNVFDAVKSDSKLFDDLTHQRKNMIFKYASEAYIDGILEKCEKNDISPITMLDEKYPNSLKDIGNAPPTIYVKGDITDIGEHTIAIVGTRNCSHRGFELVKEISYNLSKSGVRVISGMARGIDSASHIGALQAGARTFAVLGCGADVIYPPENFKIYDEILEKGAVISEYLPGVPPLAGNFPSRNRIISGLAKAVLFVESSFKSGAGITAEYATQQGKDLMAVPGAPYDTKSQLPNHIIKNGGLLVTSADDILDEYNWPKHGQNVKKTKKMNIKLDFFEEQIYNLLLKGDLSIEEIEEKSDIDQSEILSSLTILEIKGVINKNPGNIYSLKYIL